MGLSTADAPTGGGACKTVSNAPTRGFQRRTRDWRVCSYFSARLPPKGRSEGGAPVGVLFGRN